MKKTIYLFLPALLSIICTVSMLLVRDGTVVISILAFRDLCIPFIHFAVVMKDLLREKKYLRYIIPIVSSCFMLAVTIFNGYMFKWLLPLNFTWFVLSFALVSIGSMLKRLKHNSSVSRISYLAIAIIALTANALTTYLLSPIMYAWLNVDAIELIVMGVCVFVVAVYSYFLASNLTLKHLPINLVIWFVGVIISNFFALFLLGNPPEIPLKNTTTLIIWGELSLIEIISALAGLAIRYCKQVNVAKKTI